MSARSAKKPSATSGALTRAELVGPSFVVREISGEWCVFPKEKTDDGVSYWGAIIAGAPTRAEALCRLARVTP